MSISKELEALTHYWSKRDWQNVADISEDYAKQSQARRDLVAARIRSIRASSFAHGAVTDPAALHIINKTIGIAREEQAGSLDAPTKLTRAYLTEQIRSHLNKAIAPLPGINGSGSYVGDDGYSYCGLEDAACEQQEWHGYMAVALTQVKEEDF